MKVKIFLDVVPCNLAVLVISLRGIYSRNNCQKLCAWCSKQPQEGPS